jgi:hypothetical protein
MLTPENCGASQTACNIVNKTFLSLDGFAKMRQDMADTTFTAEQFGAELARITDREISDGDMRNWEEVEEQISRGEPAQNIHQPNMLFLISDGSYTSKGRVIDIQKCVIVEASHRNDYPVISAAQFLISKHGVDKNEITINPLYPPYIPMKIRGWGKTNF